MTRTVRLDRKPNILYSNDAVSSKHATRHNFQEALHTKTRQEQRILPLLRRVVVGCYCSDNMEEVERGGGGEVPESSKNDFAGWSINPRPDLVFKRQGHEGLCRGFSRLETYMQYVKPSLCRGCRAPLKSTYW